MPAACVLFLYRVCWC